jgi:AcrR family transcriptional regulator
LEPRYEILLASAKLFSTNGFTATSTREIAEKVGLRQASLFHHFARKEDILAELLRLTIDPALEFASWLAGRDPEPLAALHALCRRDTENLCSSPLNLAGLPLLPEARSDRFSEFWEGRSLLRSIYGVHLRSAEETGLLRLPCGRLTVDLIFGLVESVVTWFGNGTEADPETVSLSVADSSLRMAGVAERIVRSSRIKGQMLTSSYEAYLEKGST